jgi:hypothetical protein
MVLNVHFDRGCYASQNALSNLENHMLVGSVQLVYRISCLWHGIAL